MRTAPVFFFLALVLAASSAAAQATGPRSLRSQDDSGNVTLYLDPISMGTAALGTTGYSAEAALKAAGFYYGTYAPLTAYRSAGGGGPLKLGSTFNTAAAAFGFTYSTFAATSANVTNDFIVWARAAIDANQPVAVGLYNAIPASLGLADYDHVGLLIGYDGPAADSGSGSGSAASASTAAAPTAFRYLDLETNAIRSLPASLAAAFATRGAWTAASAPTAAPYNYAIALSPSISAVALTGLRNAGAGSTLGGRIMIHAPAFAEPTTTTVYATVAVSVVSLTATSFYTLLYFDSIARIPSTNISAASTGAVSNMTLPPVVTDVLLNLTSVASNSTAALRVVLGDAPPATTPPQYTILTNGSCANNDVGIYSLDSSTVACADLGLCRQDLCSCLGVGDSDRCWMRSFLSCDDYLACFAVATHCIETVARFSSSTSCKGLREAYAAVAPPSSVRPMSSAVWDYEFSTLSQQCSAFVCAAAQQYYFSDRCPVDESRVCDPPNYLHLKLTFSGGATKLTKAYRVNTDLSAAVAADLTTIATATLKADRPAVVLQVTTDGTLLTYNVRLDKTNFLSDNYTAFINNITGTPFPFTAVSDVLAQTPDFVGPASVQSLELLNGNRIESLFDALKNCDNSCLLAIVIVLLVLMLVVFTLVGVCYINLCRDHTADEEQSLATTVRRVKDLRRRKAALDNEDEVDLDAAAGGAENVPFGEGDSAARGRHVDPASEL